MTKDYKGGAQKDISVSLVKLSIRNLGPIREASLEIGDVTVLLGPPNSGKSYTLRALYYGLLMLDQIEREIVLKKIVNELYVWDSFINLDKTFFKALLFCIGFYNKRNMKLSKKDKEKLIERIKKILKVTLIDSEVKDNEIFVTMEVKETINIKKLAELLDDRLSLLSSNLLPIAENTQIDMPKVSASEIASLLAGAFKYPYEHRISQDTINGEPIYSNEVSLNLDNNRIMISYILKIRLDMRSSIFRILSKEAKRFAIYDLEDETNNIHLVKELSKFTLSRYLELSSSFRRLDLNIRELFDSLLSKTKTYFTRKIDAQLEKAYKELFGIDSTLFIPFGRSPFVYQLDYISKDPFGLREVIEIYENNPPYYSYIRHLSKGQSRLTQGNINEEITLMFEPVLQGELKYDPLTKRLRYKKIGCVDIPIEQASALASEVSGILLPMLSIPRNSCILIEEPEAQLHYSAQVLIALSLVGLSKLLNHKIVFSTHSDILAIVLAYLKELNYTKNDLIKLTKNLLKEQGIIVEDSIVRPIANVLSQAKNLDIKFYYYKPTAKCEIEVVEKSAKEILEEVPGITTVTDILASWAVNLEERQDDT